MQLRNLPHFTPKVTYTRALTAVKKYARQTPGIRAVYMVGTISQPGISDLDLLFVLDDTLAVPLAIEEALPVSVQKLVGRGTLLKVPARLASQVQVIDDFPLQYVWGEHYAFAKFDQPIYELCRVMDWLPERLSTLQRLRYATSVDATWTLQFLKSFAVSLKKLAELTGGTAYQPFIETVSSLRATWWTTRGRPAILRDILKEAVAVGVQAITDSNDYCVAHQYIKPLSVPPGAQFIIPRGPAFTFGERAALVRRQVILPPSFYIFYAAQVALSQGWLKKNLRDSFSVVKPKIAQRLSAELRDAIARRMSFVGECGDFLRQVGIKRGLLKYGWFLQ